MTKQGFAQFRAEEVDAGMNYAYEKCRVRLDRFLLADFGNHAGAIRLTDKVTPRKAATEAIFTWIRKGRHLRFQPNILEAYVRAIAKMMAERSPLTVQKRERDARAAEIAAVGAPNRYAQQSQGW